MPLEDFIITVFCWVEERLESLLGQDRLRQRGFAPKLADSEVLTMEVVGEFLGLDTDVGIWSYFGRHWRSWFPALGSRTTFAQQAAKLWGIKQRLHRCLLRDLGAATDPLRLVDGCPLPVCVVTRAPRCRLFPEVADWSYCAAKNQYYDGLHGPLLITINGLITACAVTSASGDERTGGALGVDRKLSGLAHRRQRLPEPFASVGTGTVGIDLQTPCTSEYDRPPSSSSGAVTHPHPSAHGNRHRATDRSVPFRENLGAGYLASN